MRCVIRHVIFAALLLLAFAAPASAQYAFMDTNGDGVSTAADRLFINGTPTVVDVWIDTNHNSDGSLATCNTADGDLGTWNSYAVNIGTPSGSVTFSNFINRVPTFSLVCVAVGVDFTSNSTEMTACRATSAPEAGGLKHMFTVTVTGQSGTPSLEFLALGNLSPNFTSFGTPCSGNDFDNTYKLGSDWFDTDGVGPAGGVSNGPPQINAPGTVNGVENSPVNVTASASDPDAADLVTLSQTNDAPFLTGPASAGPSTSPSITLTGTPNFDQAGTYTVNWTAVDNFTPPNSATDVTSVVIANTDRSPIVTAPATASGSEGTEMSFTISATDPDGEAIFSLGGAPLPGGSVFTPNATRTSGTFTWTPTFTQAGSYNVTWTATNGGSGTASTAITIANTDRAPVVTAPATASGDENTLITFTVSAADPDGQAITSLTAASSPATTGSTFTTNGTNTSGTFSWTPSLTQSGTYTVTFTASNALSGTDATVVTVNDVAVDRAPVVTAPATASAGEDSLITFTVTANDPDGDAITSLTAASSPATTGSTFTTNSTNTSGTFSWTPSFTQAGTYTVTFTASNALSGTAATTVTVNNVDRAPVVTAPATVSGVSNELITVTVTASDPDGDAIASLTETSSPATTGSTFTAGAGNTSGTFSWTPSNAQAGTYTLTFTASNALTGTAATTLNVESGDRRPVVTAPATASGDENTLITFTVSAVDPDGDAITSLTAASSPATTGSTFTTNASNTSGTWSWTPDFDQAGSYTVTFTASNALSGTAATTVTVNNVDRAPTVTAPETASGNEGTLITFTVSASDPDGDAIASLTAAPLPTGAGFTSNAAHTSGTFSWTPGFDQAGTYNVTFTASNALSGSASTEITVGNVDRAPVVTAPATASAAEGTVIQILVSAVDPDGDPIVSLTAASSPATTGSTFVTNASNTSGTFDWTPALGDAGTYVVTFTASNALSGTASTTITVTRANQAPTVTSPASVSGDENTLITFGVTATDPDGDHVTLTAIGLPTGASFIDNGDNTGTFSWTPGYTQQGTYSDLTFFGSDGNGGTGSSMTEITVQNVDRPPVADAGGPYTGVTNVAVSFDGSGSSDPDGDALAYMWDFGDGGSSTEVSPMHTYTAPGVFDVTLMVSSGSPVLSDTDATTATISDTFEANAFTVGGNKTTSLGAGKPYTCVQIEPVDGSYDNSNVLLGTIRMIYPAGSSNMIFADASKTSVDGDKNGNGAAEITACFRKADLRILFAGLPAGRNTVTVEIQGDLSTGGHFSATMEHIVKSTGAFLAASVTPNPLNPQAVLSFATSKPGAIRVQMFDPQGRLVKTIADVASANAGSHDFTIDGRSAGGSKLASGVYFVKIWAQHDGDTVQRITIMK